MKKIALFFAAAVILLSANVAQAQQVTMNKEDLMKRIERSDAEINHPKKSTRGITWEKRGELFFDVTMAPVQELFSGLAVADLKTLYGEPTATSEEEVGGRAYMVMIYPNFDTYISADGKVAFWKQKVDLYPGSIEEAYKSLDKAYELDKALAAKVKSGIEALSNIYKQRANNAFVMKDYPVAAKNFKTAYDVQLHPAVGVIDTACVYNAGLMYVIAQDLKSAQPCLEASIAHGYESNGDAYYYLYFCYTEAGDQAKSKEILRTGFDKFPDNTSIVEGLTKYYASHPEENANEVIESVQEALAKEPNNAGLWGGLGRLLEAKGDTEKALEAMAKGAELDPESYSLNFIYGFACVKAGDKQNDKITATEYKSRKAYDADVQVVLDYYSKAVAPLERAHKISPKEAAPVKLLKMVTFRLRDKSPEMQAKYDYYNGLGM